MKTTLTLSILLFAMACGSSDGSADSDSADETPSETTTQKLACGSGALYAEVHPGCAAMDAAAVPDPELGSCFCFLGYAWDGTGCVSLSDCFCEGDDCDKLAQTEEECVAAHTSCGQASTLSPLACNDPGLYATAHDQCAAMDAAAVPDPEFGSCFCFLGYAWDGTGCVSLSDCFCEGDDCDKLTQTEEECLAAHAECL
jgi:hypothetical protein